VNLAAPDCGDLNMNAIDALARLRNCKAEIAITVLSRFCAIVQNPIE